MRLLANENTPADLVRAIEGAGHDVAWVRTLRPGEPDPEILAWATREGRVLLTFDLDFGEMAFRSGLPADSGVVIVRLPTRDLAWLISRVLDALAMDVEWAGWLSVIEPGRIRATRLPSIPGS